jgi:hypothetical protein
VFVAESPAEERLLADGLGALFGIDFDRLRICDTFERPLLTVEGPIHVQAKHELDRKMIEGLRTR